MNALPSYTIVSAGLPSYEDVIRNASKKNSYSNQCATKQTTLADVRGYCTSV